MILTSLGANIMHRTQTNFDKSDGLWRRLRARLRTRAQQTLIWQIGMEYLLRKRGLISTFPNEISLDIVIEPPVKLGNVFVGTSVKIRKHTYMNSGMLWSNIDIGRYCSIGYNVIIAPIEHPLHYLSMWDNFYKNTDYYREQMKGKRTIIGNDVWIGANSVIKRGVRIEDGAVIGAGAIVVDNIPAFSVVGGAPARIIRYRFGNDVIQKLLRLKWWEIDEDFLRSLPFNDIKECIKILEDSANSQAL